MALNKSQVKTLLVVAVLAIVVMTSTYYYKKNIQLNAKFTVGVVYDYMSGTSSGPFISYFYYVNETKYEGSTYFNSDYDPSVGEFYEVKYSSKNPSFSEINQSKRITDTTLIKAAGLDLPKRKGNRFRN